MELERSAAIAEVAGKGRVCVFHRPHVGHTGEKE